TVDEDTEPLRLTLKLDRDEYQEGVFCWKGFLYYKWTLTETLKNAELVATEIMSIRPRGPAEPETKAYLQRAREFLGTAVIKVRGNARGRLGVYDPALEGRLGGEPQAFREFLLAAPSLFSELGERLGAVQHVVSFWTYRFPRGKPQMITPQELEDVFLDFED